MKKKALAIFIITLLVTLTSCTKNTDSITFKKDYESLNGTVNSNGKEYRTVNIPKNNPIIISTAKEIITKIENEETFYVYFGSSLCPWCRSVIEKALEIANDNEIDKIFYVDIWDENGNEILRNKYTTDEFGNKEIVKKGTEEYNKLLEYFDEVLSEYTYTINDEKKSYGEKRIYAPTFIYVSKGKAKRKTTGISDKQTDSRSELTKEILSDEQQLFEDFFINVCDETC